MSGAPSTGILWLDVLILSATIIVAFGGAYRVITTQVKPFVDRIQDFLDDWNGESPRPGYKGRSGVMTRLEQLENNGGSSMKDSVEKALAVAKENNRLHQMTRDKLDVTDAKLDEHLKQAREQYAHLTDFEAEHEELRKAVADLSEAMPIVARSTPPQEFQSAEH